MPTITCTSCGLECERRRTSEATYAYQCPECEYGESLIQLLPVALYELAVFGVLGLAALPGRLGRWAWRRVRPSVMTTRSASAAEAKTEVDNT